MWSKQNRFFSLSCLISFHSSFMKTESQVALTLLSRSNNLKWKSEGIKIYLILELFIFAFSNGPKDFITGL